MLDYGGQFRGAPTYLDDKIETGYDRRWNIDEAPDNLIQYPARRAAPDYGIRRAAAR